MKSTVVTGCPIRIHFGFIFVFFGCLPPLYTDWHAVASWTWGTADDACGICRMPFDGCCPDCKRPGDDCSIIWGACSHPFHLHCILKWINSQGQQPQCPMCRRDWEFKAT
eukprot:jgi/Mesvir1/27560/Mv07310-RA.1